MSIVEARRIAKPDAVGDAVETMISLLTMGRGFVTYPLPASFSNVVSVSWTMNSADNAQYFD
ncbi:MAG TPA: hypothetical protein VN853_20010, partial [Polyangia bacterium]|nr:hypothetical protein [Polyangia bacterium]